MLGKYPLIVTILVMLAAIPALSRGQDATAALAGVSEAMGRPPGTLRVTAAGSEYGVGEDVGTLGRSRIESYTLELDLGKPAAYTRLVLVDQTASDIEGPEKTETALTESSSPWSQRYRLWTTPYGFLAGALGAAAVAAESEKIAGVPYRVVSFTPAGGNEIRGYINDENLVEKTRTEFTDPVLGDVKFEASYLDWTEFDGLKYPTIIIEKENGTLHRVLVVQKVERDVTLDAAASGAAGA
jgi:hypothetical protein